MGVLETVSITSRDYSSPGGKAVTREFQVMNVTDDLFTGHSAEEFMKENNITLDFENADRFINRELNANYYKKPFMMLDRTDNAAIRAMNAEVTAGTRNVVKGFFDGTMSADALKENFKSLAYQSFQCLWENNYPNFLACNDVNSQKAMIESFYSEFRREVLAGAVDKNNAVGKQYCSDPDTPSWAYKYYNSDYYYKSEEALQAITDAVMEIAHARGYDDFEIPDYGAQGLNLYNNFNTAWSNNFDLSQQYIIDPNQAPPKDFEWFFEQGHNGSGVTVAKLVSVTSASGEIIAQFEPDSDDSPRYDPTNSGTGTTWAAYRDTNGVRHRVSADMMFHYNKADLRNVSALLAFTEGDATSDSDANCFLKNLQVYPRAYFDSPIKPIDLRA